MIEIKVGEHETVKVIFGLGTDSLAWITNKEAMLHIEQKHRGSEMELARLRQLLENNTRELLQARRDAVVNCTVTLPCIEMPTPEKIAESIKFALGRRLAPEWQLIDSAPKDGTLILVYNKAFKVVAFWHPGRDCWRNQYQGNVHGPTHWMPLPGSPE